MLKVSYDRWKGTIVHIENVETGKSGVVSLYRWHSSFIPFVAPTEGTATTGGEK